MKRLTLFFCIILIFVAGHARSEERIGHVTSIPDSIESLDKKAVFSFIIMSDNKGDSVGNRKEFARMVKWSKRNDGQFAIGLGDHVKKGRDNGFLDFLKMDEWWHDNFYPNVADGENEFYGKGQDDWGAGAPIFDVVDLVNRKNVAVRENGCEYHARIAVRGYTVHLIQLHFSDEPEDETLAFREDSKKYLIDTLEGIRKGEKDIVIVAAHSHTGFWTDNLNESDRRIVMEKCDLVLSATTHFFGRRVLKGYEQTGALVINTGSITHPFGGSPAGYVEVHVLENPLALVVQYVNAKKTKRELQNHGLVFIKAIGGDISSPDFHP